MVHNQQGPGAALLVLEDGTYFWGRAAGAPGETFGELVFNTGMTGYQEVLTDPSYRGQIVVMTYPEVGIYGVNSEDIESDALQVAGFVVHRAVPQPFSHRATSAFPDYLIGAGVVAIQGVDTRALTRRIRTCGAMRAAISTVELDVEGLLARVRQSPGISGRDLVREVHRVDQPMCPPSSDGQRRRVVLLDAGAKGNIMHELVQRGIEVAVVPYDASVSTVLDCRPAAVMISNGPGDPAVLTATVATVRGLLEHGVPVAGICLGHQLLGLALGGAVYKMRFGHRGSNHPVKDLAGGRVLVTTQNHGFAVDPTSLGIAWEPLDTAFTPTRPALLDGQRWDDGAGTMAERLPGEPLVGTSPFGFGEVEITHLSLNDGTLEGLRLRGQPVFSVQYHPEASPGPHDAAGFFEAFARLVEAPHAWA
ncbi:MAG: glutamine-hydrolyzing carbamoyl-phosphate synthase small subunit [Anaerolineales bacterium]|nr:glutamine-hydrolyzing carbamoyl-phosphate synthase small subunit [Anaerolineales bacterium]